MTGQRDGGGSARPSPALCGGLTLCFLSRPANPCARPLDETPGSQGTELRVVAEAEAGKQRVAPSACVSGSAPVCCSQLARLQSRPRQRHSCCSKSRARRGALWEASPPATRPNASPTDPEYSDPGGVVPCPLAVAP